MDNFIKKIVKNAGKIVLAKYKNYSFSCSKSDISDKVCEADILSNNYLIKKIKEKYPTHAIISEETEYKKGSQYTWVIDPMDGTRNFINEIPCFVVMVCVIFNNSVLISAIYDPINDKLFFAKKDSGTFCNNIIIRCSEKSNLINSFGGICGARLNNKKNKILNKLINMSKIGKFFIYSNGSSGITSGFVASGKWDWMVVPNGHLWDLAPAALLLSESGCMVTNLYGKPWQISDKHLLAGNQKIYKKHLMALLLK